VPPCWETIESELLQQGDYLVGCHVPEFPLEIPLNPQQSVSVAVRVMDLVVATQSCELQPRSQPADPHHLVALCQAYTLRAFAEVNPTITNRSRVDSLAKNQMAGLHLLAPRIASTDLMDHILVDFREIISLPYGYLLGRARAMGPRPRLTSPYLELYSQRLGLYFMRVGVPDQPTPRV